MPKMKPKEVERAAEDNLEQGLQRRLASRARKDDRRQRQAEASEELRRALARDR